jgi:hypothetical protein
MTVIRQSRKVVVQSRILLLSEEKKNVKRFWSGLDGEEGRENEEMNG